MSKNSGKASNHLNGLVELAPPPALTDLNTTTFENIEEEAKRVREAGVSIKAWVLDAKGKLELVSGMSREGKELMAKRISETKESLAKVLADPTPAYRRAAWLGLFMFEFGRQVQSREEVEELLAGLVKQGYLEEAETGNLKAYKKAYKVSQNSFFEGPEIEETKKMLIDFLNRAWQEVGQTREAEREKLLKESTLSVEEFLAGKTGFLTLDIPAEKVTNADKTTAYWRSGGTIKVRSDGKRVFPCAVIGSIQDTVEEAKKMRLYDAPLHIILDSLKENRPPFIKGVPEAQGKKIQLIWYLLKRGLRYLETQKQLQLSRQEMAAKATVSPKEFYLEGKSGICFTEYPEPWQVRSADGQITHRVENIFFLISREGDEKGTKRIRIVEVPDHLKDFLAPCGSEYLEKGNKFEGIPYPLGAVLQATYGQVVKSAKIANTISC